MSIRKKVIRLLIFTVTLSIAFTLYGYRVCEAEISAIDGFFESAFTAEYGDEDRAGLIRWETPICISLLGSPDESDRDYLHGLITALSENVPELPNIIINENDVPLNGYGSIEMHFIPYSDMKRTIPAYVDGNWGFFSYHRRGHVIVSGTIVIAYDVTDEGQRHHLIAEELVNLLGLSRDIEGLPDSVIYSGYPKPQKISETDFAMLRYLYDTRLEPGMSRQEVKLALQEVID